MTFVGLKCQCQDLEIGEPVVSLTLSIIFPSDIQFSYVFFLFISTTDGATMRSKEFSARFHAIRFKFV